MNWNGHRAACSLTFDDGTLGQLTNAVPELDSRGMKATFFLVSEPEKTQRQYDTAFRGAQWRAVARKGHEIGGHSATHLTPAQVTGDPAKAGEDILLGKRMLETQLDTQVTSYAYPFEFSTGVSDVVRANFRQARGKAGEDLDFYQLPSVRTAGANIHQAAKWLDRSVERNAWTVLMLHGVGAPTDFDNVPRNKFAVLLDELRGRDIWVSPFGEIAEYLRKHVCSTQPSQTMKTSTYLNVSAQS